MHETSARGATDVLASALACATWVPGKAASLGHRNCSVGLHPPRADFPDQVKLPFSRLMPSSVVVPPASLP